MNRKLILRTIISLLIWIVLDTLFSNLITSGLNKNYGLNQHASLFAVGHSHLMMALDKHKIEDELGLKMSKYTREGMNMTERFLMTKQYMSSNYSDSVRWVIVGVDLYSFQGNGLSENSYLQFYPFYDDINIDQYLKQECDVTEYYQHKFIKLSRFQEDLINSSLRGWMNDDKNRKINTFDINMPASSLKKWMRPIGFNQQLRNSLDSLITVANKTGVDIVLLNTPTLSLINDYQPIEYDSIISYYHNLANKNDNIHFLDLNPIYQDSVHLFSDPVHMNTTGRERVTNQLIQYIKDLNGSDSEQ